MNSLPTDIFVPRHIGPTDSDVRVMLESLGVGSLEELVRETVPESIRISRPLALGAPRGEREVLDELGEIAGRNQRFRSFIGMGYYDCITPPVIQRNILENPGWYTQYTPYQAEIAQGRLEALVNFQTMVADLTGLPLANASLLDEATAAAEAMSMCRAIAEDRNAFFVSSDCHPQTIGVVSTRARAAGIELDIGAPTRESLTRKRYCGMLLQYPTTEGHVADYGDLIAGAHEAGVRVVVATDLLALCLLKPPGEFGADIVVGSSQRFGVPLGAGGPHAAFLSTREEYKRQMPGRMVGVSRDARGRTAYRLALQTREQHIRRDRATSNICTAQVLLAVMAGMYAVYHGPNGLRRIAERVHGLTKVLVRGLNRLGITVKHDSFFDTVCVAGYASQVKDWVAGARARGMNFRLIDQRTLGISFDETTRLSDIDDIFTVFAGGRPTEMTAQPLATQIDPTVPDAFRRRSSYLTHPVFNRYHSETELLRYVRRLEARDLSLTTSMIPLGSCTMKLNATSEMLPVTWPAFGGIHPFAPSEQTRGYGVLYEQLERWLAEITGFSAVSLQPNAGSQGEYAGLLVIRAFHESRGQGGRDVCLIPVSAHGTNPASAAMCGLKVVAVACDAQGNVEIDDLERKAREYADSLALIMITYPSTHGVFEEQVKRICEIVHECGGQVYMDGANMNAQVGLCRPAEIGADVCHLNLHKTFCIPHGGGGPGMGPIGVAAHLAPFLPGHPVTGGGGQQAIGPIAAAPYGSPSILTIPWVYIALMGGDGLTRASQVAILNANYMAARLREHYPVLYSGARGRVAHEFIIDCRGFKKTAGIEVEDIAKRLMDYGFHAPTMSFPVPGTLMIEPTESESKGELDRFCDALVMIRREIEAIEQGKLSREDNPLKNAPHTMADVISSEWQRGYSREQAAFPAPWLREHKFWPSVGRIDNAYGDRNLFCTCPPMVS